MISTPHLWLSDRDFPIAPLFDWIPIPVAPLDTILAVIFSILFILFIFKSTYKIGVPIVLLFIYFALIDQTRLQPFFFELIFVVLAMTLFSNNRKRVEQCLLLIFIGTYFWSGMHKLNAVFFDKWMLGMSSRIPFIPTQVRALFTYAIPFMEASFGLALLFNRTRKYGVLLIATMHSIIVATLLIEGFGYIVIPMTLFNVITLFVLFYSYKSSIKEIFKLDHFKPIAIFLIAILFPLLNFFGMYDHLLSFSYFSGKPEYARIWLMDSTDLEKLPKSTSKYMQEWEGYIYVDLNWWSQESLGVGVYPEMRVYEHINGYIQKELGSETATQLDFY
jgi:hypothetical protein